MTSKVLIVILSIQIYFQQLLVSQTFETSVAELSQLFKHLTLHYAPRRPHRPLLTGYEALDALFNRPDHVHLHPP